MADRHPDLGLRGGRAVAPHQVEVTSDLEPAGAVGLPTVGALARLTPVGEDDLGFLYWMSAAVVDAFAWRYGRGAVPPPDRFAPDLLGAAHPLLVVRSRDDGAPVALAMVHQQSLEHGFAFISFRENPAVARAAVATEGLRLFVGCLFAGSPLRSLYMTLPARAEPAGSSPGRWTEVARVPGRGYFQGERFDEVTYLLTREAAACFDGTRPGPDLEPPALSSRRFHLSPVLPAHLPPLHALASDPQVAVRWEFGSRLLSFGAFSKALFERVHLQFTVLRRTDQAPVGIVRCYDLDLNARTAFVSVVVDKGAGVGAGIESLALFVHHVFSLWELDAVLFEFPVFNEPQFASAVGDLIEEVGLFPDFYFHGGRQWDRRLTRLTRDAFYSRPGLVRRGGPT